MGARTLEGGEQLSFSVTASTVETYGTLLYVDQLGGVIWQHRRGTICEAGE